ncbi:3-hydroxyisobutyryl-CoA hydrolase [Cryptococcus wingfieldii CBS 7118]|uniref:3-hydroxyisobutyryl-CoA hydrolase n=1 Tax=Cryptococcus wingfieldii CBS 7118 TaxID=1295528 RepID=A0A1E3J087_9TREE|nr:3-hydroxyisobutyryl-CoA hydrolase [Cryptococcus wingfieldii CBS 7118]ODN94259.1 3-hydroxyisobutyryl-CoA hydrolase [Cryptococcus wingfieldii CBS 7118]
MSSFARLPLRSRMGASPATRLAAVQRHLTTSAPKMASAEELVQFESHQDTRVYKLNRSAKLNSLNEEMITLLSSKLKNWRELDSVKVIIGRGDERAFCAGGDVKQLVLDLEAGKDTAVKFFKGEFQMNWVLGRLGKPYIAIIDGVTMGGGGGLSLPAPIRIATPRTIFAMPETKIGYSPDVGANYYLSQLDGSIGAWLAVTGQEVYGRAAYELGIATHFVTENNIPEIISQITQHTSPSLQSLSALIASFSASSSATTTPSSKSSPDGPSPIKGEVRKFLDKAFKKKSIQEIYQTLDQAEGDASLSAEVKEWAKVQKGHMDARSPTGMAVALQNHQKAKSSKRLDRTLLNDFSMATAFCGKDRATDDFITGVTAVLIERSKTPTAWTPSSISDPSLSPSEINSKFFSSSSPHLKNIEEIGFSPASASSLDSGRDSTWGQFRKFGLPSEAAVKAAVEGYAPGSGAFALTEAELVEQFVDAQGDIKGSRRSEVEQRVRSVVASCCKTGKDGYLEWTA